MIPESSDYPISLDTDDNLFLVHDSLRVRLAEDYNPGDIKIYIEGDSDVISKFPPTGIITLTEQCSDIDKRAISFYYGSKTSSTFDEIIILPEFEDLVKPKKITNVTMNVLDKHHNYLKDSIIKIQTFLGTKTQASDASPFGQTITGRINFLKNLTYKPRAWFTTDTTLGLVPLEVTFTENSFRKGDGKVTYTWNMGDGTVIVTNESIIEPHVYQIPGLYTVSLNVKNEYGEDTVAFESLINAKIEAPKTAYINVVPKASQTYTDGDLVNNVYPKIRSSVNTFIDFEISEGENPLTPGYSYSGELLDGSNNAIDQIVEYNWQLGDELIHSSSKLTKASYSIGGYYDIILRVDTEFGSYRITKYDNSIDIIENQNLWLFNLKNITSVDAGDLEAWEFGLLGSTFKKLGNQTIFLNRDNSFLDPYGNTIIYNSETHAKAKKEFFRNVAFAQQSTLNSGDKGDSLLFWASGGLSIGDQEIRIKKYNGFDDTYTSLSSITSRPWNWVSLVSQDTVYFLLGQTDIVTPGANYAKPTRVDYDLSSLSAASPISLYANNFENGADELLSHPSYFNENGVPTNGYFATYKTAWKDSTGYILRNSSVNEFYRISDFYKTVGNTSSPYNSITRLPDMTGIAKTEGELVALSTGVFFFNNSGEISAWNDTTLTWETGRAGSSSTSFRSLQDSGISGFDSKSNSLLAVSDSDRLAYLSYDYSTGAFIKFNATDLTFQKAGSTNRPSGSQLKLGIY
jgi:PKD repeat protein